MTIYTLLRYLNTKRPLCTLRDANKLFLPTGTWMSLSKAVEEAHVVCCLIGALLRAPEGLGQQGDGGDFTGSMGGDPWAEENPVVVVPLDWLAQVLVEALSRASGTDPPSDDPMEASSSSTVSWHRRRGGHQVAEAEAEVGSLPMSSLACDPLDLQSQQPHRLELFESCLSLLMAVTGQSPVVAEVIALGAPLSERLDAALEWFVGSAGVIRRQQDPLLGETQTWTCAPEFVQWALELCGVLPRSEVTQ